MQTLRPRLRALRSCLAIAAWALGSVAGAWAQAAGPASAPEGEPAASAPTAVSAPSGPARAALALPRPVRDEGRLRAGQIGLVINEDDPYSVAVGAHYQVRRGLSDTQVLRVRVPRKARLEREEFAALRLRIEEHFGPQVQALALAWRTPFAVQCQSITGALALGWQPGFCRASCDAGPASPYFNQATALPFTRLGLRPSMLLAAADVAQARQMIDRGVASDGTLGRTFGTPSAAVFLRTADAARNVRAPLFPESGYLMSRSLALRTLDAASAGRQDDVVLLLTGAARLEHLDRFGFVPGALADHLTSYGGVLDASGGQSTALEWIAAGATASHGTVSEPCNHLQKFPLPPLLLGHYLQGVTALEAYWKSVAWPLQSVFVGEPLAAPFARDVVAP